MSRPRSWQEHWLDVACHGFPMREWCTNVKKEKGKAHCRYCDLTIKYLTKGVRALKVHGASKRHMDNRKVAVAKRKKVKAKCSHEVIKKQRNGATDIHLSKGVTKCLSSQRPANIKVPTAGIVPQNKGVTNCWINNHKKSTWNQENCLKTPAKTSLIEVYMCVFCATEFSTVSELHIHQEMCSMKLPQTQASVPDGQDAQMLWQRDLERSPTRTVRRERHTSASDTSGMQIPPKSELIAALNLLPQKKARLVSQRRRNTECESIDLGEEVMPILPSTPRTPKLLISHLSRDGNEAHKRRLSLFSGSHGEKDTLDLNERHSEEESESQNVFDGQERQKMTINKSLYNLDITSPLGQFVIKHFKGDPSLHILSDIESHCLTSSPKKNPNTSRLRERHAAYPITFRGYPGKASSCSTHQYKFTSRQVKAFMARVNTGLDAKSRCLLKQMKQCKVHLKYITKADLKQWMPSQNEVTVGLRPLSAEEIAFWTSPKHLPSEDSIISFPKGLSFSSPNVNHVLGIKSKQDLAFLRKFKPYLSLTNIVSEDVAAELSENRKTIYKSLLADAAQNESLCLGTANSSTTSPSLLRLLLASNNSSMDVSSHLNSLPDIANLEVTSGKTCVGKNIPSSCESPELSCDSIDGECNFLKGNDFPKKRGSDGRPGPKVLEGFNVKVIEDLGGEEILVLRKCPHLLNKLRFPNDGLNVDNLKKIVSESLQKVLGKKERYLYKDTPLKQPESPVLQDEGISNSLCDSASHEVENSEAGSIGIETRTGENSVSLSTLEDFCTIPSSDFQRLFKSSSSSLHASSNTGVARRAHQRISSKMFKHGRSKKKRMGVRKLPRNTRGG